MIKRNLKLMCKLSAITFGVSLSLTSLASASVNSRSYDYSNPIYSEGINDTFVYDNTDSVITTKTGIQRTLPQVTGRYDISSYPIPLTNVVPNEATFELIKAENKEIMDRVEEDIKNGTLTKHKAADGQFYGTVPDDALGV